MREQASSTLKSLATIVSGDLTEAVASTTVASWRETLAMILTYAREEEFITLCQQLGERLEQLGARDEALLCSICAVDVGSLLRLGLGASQDYRVRSHLSVMEVLLILCTMVPVQDLHLDAKLATLGEKLAVLCEALEAQGMNSITSHFLQSLRSAPSAQSLLQAMAAALALRSLRPVAAPSHGRRRPGVAPRLPPRGSAAACGSAAAAHCFPARCFSAHGSSVRKAVRSIRAAHDARSSQSPHARSQALHARCRRARSQALHAYAVRPCGAAHDAPTHDAAAHDATA